MRLLLSALLVAFAMPAMAQTFPGIPNTPAPNLPGINNGVVFSGATLDVATGQVGTIKALNPIGGTLGQLQFNGNAFLISVQPKP